MFIWSSEDAKVLGWRIISSLQRVATWPLDIVIEKDVSHQTLEFIDSKKPTGAADEVSKSLLP
jgi:hypothetical protein